MNLAVVIAAYNEAANLPTLTTRLIRALDAIPDCRWQLVYVIEGKDGSREIAEGFSREREEIQLIYGEQPSGLGNAFRKGFEAVRPDTDFLVTMDADLNHQPEEIHRLIDALERHKVDIVIGSRKVAGSTIVGTPMWKRVLSDVLNLVMKRMMAMPVKDQTSGFRVYRYSSFRRISYTNSGFAFLPEILICAHHRGLSIREERIQFVFREQGSSKMNLMATSLSYIAFLRNLIKIRTNGRGDS